MLLSLLSLIPLFAGPSVVLAQPNPPITNSFPIPQAALVDRARLEQQGAALHLVNRRNELNRHAKRAAIEEVRGRGEGKRGLMKVVKRQSGQSCIVRPTSSLTSTTNLGGGLAASPSTTTQAQQTTTTTQAQQTTTQTQNTPSPSPSPSPVSSSVTVDPSGTGPFSGYGTWFDVVRSPCIFILPPLLHFRSSSLKTLADSQGLGACGWTNVSQDPIVAVSAQLFDNWPGYNGWNPNDNPICGKHLTISYGGKSLTVQVADRCPGCDLRSLDLSLGAFEWFADAGVGWFADGYTQNITWSWVTGSGAVPQVPVTPYQGHY